jgi:spore maturation protein CgeB
MRGQHLKSILKPDLFAVADIDIVNSTLNPLAKSLGWRFKVGPLIKRINQLVNKVIEQHENFDIVWVDKGVFVRPEILINLKKRGTTLIHFTPDTAFLHNKSRLFYRALPFYDFCITTKSFELNYYQNNGAKKVLFCTQGYDPCIHKPYHTAEEKSGVVFIGHNEPWREEIISALLDAGVQVKLAGARWDRYATKHTNDLLSYYGTGLFGEAYAKLISESQIALGLLSKIFPEMHTTRTFEIPACGTLLATEINDEVLSFYSNDEVLFFQDKSALVSDIRRLLNSPQYLNEMSVKGYVKVTTAGYDYEHILRKLLKEMEIV